MIGYLDRTWCPDTISRTCQRREGCYRVFTEEDRANAIRWWGKEAFPISYFKENPECYIPIHTTDGQE